MTRNLKTLGLALIAAFAMSATMAAAAQADPFWIKSDGTPTTLSGAATGEEAFAFDAGIFSCNKVFYPGSFAGTTVTTLTLTPEFLGECKFAGLPAVVDLHGCSYVFHTHTKIEMTKFTVTTTISCPAGNELTITTIAPGGTLKCTEHIPPQTIATGITFTNAVAGGVKHIEADINITTGLTYTQKAGTGAGVCANGNDTANGQYVGNVTIGGGNTKGVATDLWVE
jgi:hypothetical protein